METLHRETVDLGGGVRAELHSHAVVIVVFDSTLRVVPTTRQQANRASIALKKSARRLQAIGRTLPSEPAG